MDRKSAKACRKAGLSPAANRATRFGFVLAIAVLSTGRSWAQDSSGDGLYGRMSGDLILSAGLGGALASAHGHRAAVDLRARYLDSLGIVVSPEWTPSGRNGAVAVALEIRPLFLARFLRNAYSGRAWDDLTLDSLGVEIGSWLGPFDKGFGAAFLLATGVEMPFSERGDRGFWVRIAGRYLYASSGDQAAPAGGRSEVAALVALIFRTSVDIGLANWEPARYTP